MTKLFGCIEKKCHIGYMRSAGYMRVENYSPYSTVLNQMAMNAFGKERYIYPAAKMFV